MEVKKKFGRAQPELLLNGLEQGNVQENVSF